MDEQHKQEAKRAYDSLQWIRVFDPTHLQDWDGWGKHVSREIVADIFCLVNAYRRFSLKVLGEMPRDERSELANLAQRGERALETSSRPSLEDDPRAIKAWVDGVRKMCRETLPIVQDLADRSTAGGHMLEDAKTRLAQIRQLSDAATSAHEKTLAAAAEAGVTQQAVHFGAAARAHEKSSRWWCAFSVVAGILLAFYALLGDRLLPDAADGVYAIARTAVSRVLVFAVLGYALFFCVRNYMAHRHNAIVNRHRQNALDTYRALAEADPKSRDVVLAHAAWCIYAPQDSGFARKGESESGSVPVETFLRIAGKKGND